MDKKKLSKKIMKKAVLVMIPIFFILGWGLSYFYSLKELPFDLKPIKRFELKKRLNLFSSEKITVKILKNENAGTHEKKLIQITWNELQTEAYLLMPKDCRIKYPAILALHGHLTTKEEVVGIKSSQFGVNYGLKLAEAGYCVLAPDIPFAKNIGVEDHIGLNLIMTGKNLMGFRVAYLRALLQYLHSLPFVDAKRIGCIGWSMGGGLAMYLAAVDKRVKVVAISGYFGTYRGIFMKQRHSTDNYIPGILTFGEMPDVACLIAPRPLWVEGSKKDTSFPLESFMEGLERLKSCYEGNNEYFAYHIIEGGHRFQGEDIVKWFEGHL